MGVFDRMANLGKGMARVWFGKGTSGAEEALDAELAEMEASQRSASRPEPRVVPSDERSPEPARTPAPRPDPPRDPLADGRKRSL